MFMQEPMGIRPCQKMHNTEEDLGVLGKTRRRSHMQQLLYSPLPKWARRIKKGFYQRNHLKPLMNQ